jgi:hypothetical protein
MRDKRQDGPADSEGNHTVEPDDLEKDTIADLDVLEEDTDLIAGGLTMVASGVHFNSPGCPPGSSSA